jgi:hypothetical protein
MKENKKRKVAVILIGLVFLLMPAAIRAQESDTTESTDSTFNFNIGDTVYLYLGKYGDSAFVSITDTDLVTLIRYRDGFNIVKVNKLLKSDKVLRIGWGTPAQVLDTASCDRKGRAFPLYKVKILSGVYKDRVGWVPGSECERTFRKIDLELVGGEDGIRVERKSYNLYFVGIIRNNTDRRYDYVRITFSLYDKDGNKMGYTSASIHGLNPGESWKFVAPATAVILAPYFMVDEIVGE